MRQIGQCFRLSHDVLRRLQQLPPLGRQFDGAGRPPQQADPKQLFQPRHRPAECRGRDPQPSPGLGKAAILDHRDKGRQIARLWQFVHLAQRPFANLSVHTKA